MEINNYNSPKYAFFYMLSLISLGFTGFSVGIIVFQIINKYIPDAINQFRYSFDPSALRFAISALLVAAPVFFIINYFIHKSLYNGTLPEDSKIRKWLTYFILLVSSVVTLGWFIGLINIFLGGELTLKFSLKALVSIIISSLIFSFYLYDIRRKNIMGIKDNIIKIYFYVSLIIVLIALPSALIFGESPMEARDKKIDMVILNNFSDIKLGIHQYYINNDILPESLSILSQEIKFITPEMINYQYDILSKTEFELCADFKTSNIEEGNSRYERYREIWPHEKGNQCIKNNIEELKEGVRLQF